jgi:NAD(P) transhydrogenase
MIEQGVEVLFNDEAIEIDAAPDPMRVRLKSGKSCEFDAILVSAGRASCTDDLGLDKIGLETGAKGLIKVNDQYQSAIPHIYAAGDVIGFPALASTSREQARIAMVHAFDIRDQLNLTRVLPYGIYTVPECSMAGATEEQLQKDQTPYVVGRALYAHNSRGLIIGDRGGFLKLLFHAESLKLLGVHVIGEQATDLVHIGLTALLIGAGADLFIQTCYNHPTLSELYKEAAFAALNAIRAKNGECPGPVGTLT